MSREEMVAKVEQTIWLTLLDGNEPGTVHSGPADGSWINPEYGSGCGIIDGAVDMKAVAAAVVDAVIGILGPPF